tara:strand:- start:40 stop:417 length:378 start_codon:yes stop_codon:yes gene_type:complete
MAGLFYLPRLFVYHSSCEKNSDQYVTFTTMEKKLLRFIMNPSMFLTWFLGIALALLNNYFLTTWLIIKITLVVLLSVFHMYCAKIRKDFEVYNNEKEESFFRIINEIPTILFILIVLIVVFKPFD